MITVQNIAGDTPEVLERASKLMERVRNKKRQMDVLSFLACLHAVAREVNEAFMKAKAELESGELGDETFRRVYVAGSTHAILLDFCQSLSKDDEELVRLASASGEIVLADIDRSPGAIAVIKAMQKRLAQAD